MHRSKAAAVALAAAAAVAAPLGLATPAQASTTSGLCTVTPLAPYFNGDFTSSGRKRVAYPVQVTCSAGRTISITQERWEQDLVSREGKAPDDYLGRSTLYQDFTLAGGTRTINVNATLPETETDNYEEVYQRVRFTVTSGGVTSAATAWELTNAVFIHR